VLQGKRIDENLVYAMVEEFFKILNGFNPASCCEGDIESLAVTQI